MIKLYAALVKGTMRGQKAVMTNLIEQKKTARKAAFARRKAARSAEADAKAVANLISVLISHKGKPMAGYMPIQTEVDPRPAMAALQAFNPVGVPVISGPGQPLTFKSWTPEAEMIDGPFGAKVPAKGAVITPEVVIVPLVAFTREGHRLGYGGGFYDRTLEGLRARGPVIAIGYAYDAQEAQSLPMEPTDQPLDLIVTDQEVITL